MRRRNLWSLIGLRRRLGLAGGALSPPGRARLWRCHPATFRLPLRRQPAADFSQAFGLLAIPLVPAPRLVPRTHPFASKASRPAAPSGLGTPASPLNLMGAHGSSSPKGKARGKCGYILLGFIKTRKTLPRQSIGFSGTRQRDKRSHRRTGNKNPSTAHQRIESSPPNPRSAPNRTPSLFMTHSVRYSVARYADRTIPKVLSPQIGLEPAGRTFPRLPFP